MSVGLLYNSIVVGIHSFLGWFIPHVFPVAGVWVYDWVHYPNYAIYIDDEISTSQLYVEDIQLEVKYTRNEKGATLGYVGDDEKIDVTNFVAHVSLEGTIMMWGRDDDPYGMFVVVVPFNTLVKNLIPNGSAIIVEPQPESAQAFSSMDVRWQPADVPGHWFISSPRVDIDTKWNRNDRYPYVSTTYFLRKVSRYDDKWFDPKYVAFGNDIGVYRQTPPQVSTAEFLSCIDKASLFLSMVKKKYEVEPLTFNNYRKFY